MRSEKSYYEKQRTNWMVDKKTHERVMFLSKLENKSMIRFSDNICMDISEGKYDFLIQKKSQQKAVSVHQSALRLAKDKLENSADNVLSVFEKVIDYKMKNRFSDFVEEDKPSIDIPKFVIDWIDSYFFVVYSDRDKIDFILNYERYAVEYGSEDLSEWLSKSSNVLSMVRLIIDTDYERKNEILYSVQLSDSIGLTKYLSEMESDRKVYLNDNYLAQDTQNTTYKLTKKDIMTFDENYMGFAKEIFGINC